MTTNPTDAPAPEDVGPILREALTRIGGTDPGLVPFALGWATVDLERTAQAFAEVWGLADGPIGAVMDAPNDALLGARCRIVHPGDPRVPIVVLLEPITEGRLAATLARHGEGPAVAWLRAPGEVETASPAVVASSRGRLAPTPGPFGPESLVSDRRWSGPHRLLVARPPGTITP